MSAKKWFAQMSTAELVCWWGQYGTPNQSPYYPSAPRRAARRELLSRGITPQKDWNYTSGWGW